VRTTDQGGLLGLGQGVSDGVDDGGLVRPEPVAGHRREPGERGDQGLLRGMTRGLTPGATVA
jgi:hypothetical protein